ncbi:Tat (twin-arginine translocation) pathway signal sequence [Cyclobacterium xiamenense]|uniref:Tat (Twin-arginine translocation) pathway signal sequence n=1 Tax=Cyclobacterium xiamenense TaxID=1297121 RepID=A0A1H6TX82_9BACT|nr:Gfo/Idh/MocA family oxidoreductase [Cyclobacterium xiamenense]SEI80362.1 Tat (twin-arginine translocation) pathway signal sequence [Cyclobacterium xiamenense]
MKKNNMPDEGNSRRNFLKTSATAVAGFYIVPRHVLGGPGFKAPSDKLRIAGIGAGGKGYSDIRSFYESGNADIVALCDVDPERAARSIEAYPKARFYKDYREMLEKEADSIDAVSVSTPDHNHAVQALTAMKMGKHVYVQKPLTHTIQEARMLTEAAEKYKLVTQMGNQGASGDGVRQMREWYAAGLIGEATKVQCWTNRPVWPQGVPWPGESGKKAPKNLDWDLWLGTAEEKGYVENLHPFNWRGWWEFGTGALGDMACHIMEPAFRTLDLGYPTEAECSVGSVYTGEFTQGYFPKSCPPSSHITLRFKRPTGKDLEFHWMDGGIKPSRPEELGASEQMGDGGNGVIIEGTRGKMMCSTYGIDPKLLPTSINESVNVAPTLPRVEGAIGGHYAQWVNACIAGYGSKEYKELSSPFSIAGPLTESVLMGNLAIRSYDYREPKSEGNGYNYPGRDIKLLWDGKNMKVTNFEPANQFVSKTYRAGFELPQV